MLNGIYVLVLFFIILTSCCRFFVLNDSDAIVISKIEDSDAFIVLKRILMINSILKKNMILYMILTFTVLRH